MIPTGEKDEGKLKLGWRREKKFDCSEGGPGVRPNEDRPKDLSSEDEAS